MPFGVCNAPWLFTEIAHETLGHIPELHIYMDDLCNIRNVGKPFKIFGEHVRRPASGWSHFEAV